MRCRRSSRRWSILTSLLALRTLICLAGNILALNRRLGRFIFDSLFCTLAQQPLAWIKVSSRTVRPRIKRCFDHQQVLRLINRFLRARHRPPSGKWWFWDRSLISLTFRQWRWKGLPFSRNGVPFEATIPIRVWKRCSRRRERMATSNRLFWGTGRPRGILSGILLSSAKHIQSPFLRHGSRLPKCDRGLRFTVFRRCHGFGEAIERAASFCLRAAY